MTTKTDDDANHRYEFCVLDVPDDAAAIDARDQVLRAAAAAGLGEVTVRGRFDKTSTYWACRYLVVSYWAPPAAAYAFTAWLEAAGLCVWYASDGRSAPFLARWRAG